MKTYSTPTYPDFHVWWKITNGQIKSSPSENTILVLWDNIGSGTLELFRIGRDTSILNIDVNPLPPKPTITRKGDSLYSKTDYDTKWYCDGSLVDSYNGKKAIQLRYDRYHYYTVMQIGQNHCSSEMSEPFYFDPYSSVKEEFSRSLIVFPNPASDNISITFPGGINQSIHIYNSLGFEMRRFEAKDLFGKNSINISMEGFPSGMYYVRQDIGCLPDIQCLTKNFVLIR